jgi:hypothetical protein
MAGKSGKGMPPAVMAALHDHVAAAHEHAGAAAQMMSDMMDGQAEPPADGAGKPAAAKPAVLARPPAFTPGSGAARSLKAATNGRQG